MTAPVTPADGVRELLLSLVIEWRRVTRELHLRGDAVLTITGNVVGHAVAVRDGTAKVDGLQADQLAALIDELLAMDPHLRLTCVTPWRLGLALDTLILNQLAFSLALLEDESIGNDTICQHLIREVYSGAYTRTFFGRLYNVRSGDSSLPVPSIHASVVELTSSTIARLTGEQTPSSTLHRANTGDAFLVFIDHEGGDDLAWWNQCWKTTRRFVQTLQYVKADVVDFDYAMWSFSPDWVNRVRRYGIPIGGRPRVDVQPNRYQLDQEDLRVAISYLAAADAHRALLDNEKPTLRRATRIAGDYYESYHRRDSPAEQLISLAVALEALFSPTDRQELSFRIAVTAAVLLGLDSRDAQAIAPFVRKVYRARSDLMHGGANPFDSARGERSITDSDLQRLANYVRESILRVLTLHARGGGDRASFLQELEAAVLDSEKAQTLRARSDWSAYLAEKGLDSV